MPYKVVESQRRWYVKNEDTGEMAPKGGYVTKRKAEKYCRALQANVHHKGLGDLIIYFEDSAIKSLDATDGMVGGYSVLWGDKKKTDFHGNWFTPETFTGHNKGNGSVATINHRIPFFRKGQFDPATDKLLRSIVANPMKNPITTEVDEVGIFSKLVLDLSDRYEKAVYGLSKAGAMKWSSGTAPHLYEEEPSGELKMFVIAEQALTPIPAEPLMLQHRVLPIKSYMDFLEGKSLPEGNFTKAVEGGSRKSTATLKNFLRSNR